MPSNGRRCDECEFWQEPGTNNEDAPDVGQCRRRGVNFYIDSTGRRSGAWPRVKGTGWCGEFSPNVKDEILNDVKEWATQKSPLDNTEIDG